VDNEEKVKTTIKKIEQIDEAKESLINKLEINQKELANLINKRNSKMLVYLFFVVLASLVVIPFSSFLYSLGVLVLGTGLGIGIKELLKQKEKSYILENKELLEKIEKSKDQKAALKNELSKYITKDKEEDILDIIDKRLYEIKLEKEELNKLRNLMNEEANYIDIKDVYVVQVNNIKYIARLERPHKMLHRFVDVFNYVEIWSQVGSTFDDAVRRHNKHYDEPLNYQNIKEAEPALLAYPDNLVPDYVLRQAFYKQNEVDLNSPVLKKGKD